MNILVIGSGSIGKNHLKTLQNLSERYLLNIFTFQPVSYEKAAYLKEVKQTIKKLDIRAAFICNPTSLHFDTMAVCLENNAHTFVEKPIVESYRVKDVQKIKKLINKNKLTVMVGYDMRFNLWIGTIKELLNKRVIGDLWGVRIVAGQYLPDWRPGTDYRKVYSAQKKMGGGVLRDLSHEIDYLNWFVEKKISSIIATKITTGILEIDTEDICELLIKYKDKSVANIHLDYLNIPYRRSIELYGSAGTILFDDNSQELKYYLKEKGIWQSLTLAKEKTTGRASFERELGHFFDCINGHKTPLNSMENALSVSKIIDIADKSSLKKSEVRFN